MSQSAGRPIVAHHEPLRVQQRPSLEHLVHRVPEILAQYAQVRIATSQSGQSRRRFALCCQLPVQCPNRIELRRAGERIQPLVELLGLGRRAAGSRPRGLETGPPQHVDKLCARQSLQAARPIAIIERWRCQHHLVLPEQLLHSRRPQNHFDQHGVAGAADQVELERLAGRRRQVAQPIIARGQLQFIARRNQQRLPSDLARTCPCGRRLRWSESRNWTGPGRRLEGANPFSARQRRRVGPAASPQSGSRLERRVSANA